MNFHGGYFGKEKLKDFSVNIPTLPYPNGLKELLIDEIEGLVRYPEIDGITAKQAISASIGVDDSQIILGNGATELIYLYARSTGIKKAVILEPTFTEYRRALELNEIDVVSFSYLDQIKQDGNISSINLNEEAFAEAVAEKLRGESADLLVLCNPNNPTGHYYEAAWIESVIEKSGIEHLKVFIDESFSDFLKSEIKERIEIKPSESNHVFLLRSMTKNFEVPGLRIGYGIGNRDTILKMSKYKEPWSLNAFALKSIPFFLKQQAHLEMLQKWSNDECNCMMDTLKKVQELTVFEGYANFVLIKVKDGFGDVTFKALIDRGYYLRRCEDFEGLGKDYFRIALRSNAENVALATVIGEVIGGM